MDKGYLIDISTRELLHQTNDLPALESLIHTTNPEYFLVGACYGIYIFDNRKLVKRYDPDFTVDGIYFTGQQDQKAIGHLYASGYNQNFNIGFSFDLVTNELSIDKKVKFRKK